MIFLVIWLSAAQPTFDVDCAKVRWFVRTYGESQAMEIARRWGYSEQKIREGKKCLAKSTGG